MFGLERIADALDRMLNEAQRGYDRELADAGREAGDFFGEDSGWTTATAIPAGIAWSIASSVVLLEKGFVDVLRYGEGSKTGTATGVAQDGLRLLSILPGVGAAGRGIARVGRTSVAARALEAAGQGGMMSCGPEAILSAGRLSGQRTTLTLGEVGQAFGKGNPNSPMFPGMFYGEIRNVLGTLGITNREVRIADEGLQAVEGLAAQNKGPVIFGVRWWAPNSGGILAPATRTRFNTQTGLPYTTQLNAANNMTQAADHWLLAFRGPNGRILVADQFGTRPIAELGTFAGVQSQFTMSSHLLQVENALVMTSAQAAKAETAFGALGSATQSARSAQWIARSIALEMVVVDGPTTLRIDSAIRQQLGRPPRGSAQGTGNGSGTGSGGGRSDTRLSGMRDEPPVTMPMPNVLSPTLLQDAQLILANLPRNGDTTEFGTLQVNTKLSSARLRDGLLQLLKSGLATATKWGTVDGKDTPALVRRALGR